MSELMYNMNTHISAEDRLNLKRLVDNSECENNTENIRKLKHSVPINEDIKKMLKYKINNDSLKQSDPETFLEGCKIECSFLFNNYTDIFNKILKDELDMTIMKKLVIILKLIEDEKVDQHEGSVMVGKILKELYVDSALKRCDNLDKEYASSKQTVNDGKKISWKDFKFVKN
jgi:hypothetical protein